MKAISASFTKYYMPSSPIRGWEQKMSEFAFFRFLSLELLTEEEKVNKTEIISITEEVLDAEGIECDSKVAQLPEETMKKIIAEVRKRRRRKAQSQPATEEGKVEEDKKKKEQEASVHAK
jgi:hypothetical protein